MKVIPIALATNIESETPTISIGVRFVRKDLTVVGVSNYDRNVTIAGEAYESAAGFDPKDVASADNLEVDNTSIEGIIVSPSITDADLRARRWDGAKFEMFHFNWANPSAGITRIRVGKMGEVQMNRQQFIAGLLGLMQGLQATFGQNTSPQCRHVFCDLGRTPGSADYGCLLDIADFTVTGTISAADSDFLTMHDAARTEPTDTFAFGVMTILDGLNIGIATEVKTSIPGQWVLQEQLPFDATGAAYSMSQGCDLLYATCDTRFNNLLNRDAEDFLKGFDQFIQVGRKS